MEDNKILKLLELFQNQNNQFFFTMGQLAGLIDRNDLTDAEKIVLIEELYKECLIKIYGFNLIKDNVLGEE